MKNNVKQNNGITLVALVITIVILLILAGVSINLVLGQNGLITRAQEAVLKTNKEIEKESQVFENIDKDIYQMVENLTVYDTIYATLYTDGTLVFAGTDKTEENKEILKNYGEINNIEINNTESIPWNNERTSITHFKVADTDLIRPKNMAFWFCNCSNLIEIDLSHINTENVTSMQSLFQGCSKLTELDLSKFDTRNVTSMEAMFANASGLKYLDLNNFNTRNVTNMGGMFANASGLEYLDLNNFNTSNVTNMMSMFDLCSNLKSIEMKNFDTSKVTSMQFMFENCKKLTHLDLSKFTNENLTNTIAMFFGCENLETINIDETQWKKKTVEQSDSMFYNCFKLKGENGTVYNGSIIDYTYARVDKVGEPGYFTSIGNKN